MGKASRLKGERSRAHSEDLTEDLCRLAALLGVQSAKPTDAPQGAALLQSAREAIHQAVPATFIHEGRTYWLRIAIAMAHLEVFDSASGSQPCVRTVCGSSERFGYTPAAAT